MSNISLFVCGSIHQGHESFLDVFFYELIGTVMTPSEVPVAFNLFSGPPHYIPGVFNFETSNWKTLSSQ